jgi:NAD/NADP transhydrogenase beta subunit
MLASALLIGQVLEAGMLICFGVSWPVDILKTLRTRRTEGKSLVFMSLVLSGYMLGLGAKLARAAEVGEMPELISVLYVFNAVMIVVDIAVTLRMRRRSSAQPIR